MVELDAAYFDIADDFGCTVVVAVVVGIDSYCFRHFRFHPCTMAIVVAADSLASSLPLKWLTSTMTRARNRVTTREVVERAACIYGTINHLHLFRSRRRIDRDHL